jgi:hypothetical protein
VNGEPLGFYHFSGFDSGDQALMLGKYGANNESLESLRDWYIQQCEERGQSVLGKIPSIYFCYADGCRIEAAERRLYRERVDLQRAFPNPFATGPTGGYAAWYQGNVTLIAAGDVSIERAPAEVFAEFRAWLENRALLTSNRWRRLAIRGLNRCLGLAAYAFARSDR